MDENVSRETIERLRAFVALLEKWNAKINLVSNATLADAWQRHVVDSLQIWDVIRTQPPGKLVDIGSGGGFPGIVLAACMHEAGWPGPVLIESDVRKVTFLRTALRELGLEGNVLAQRIESSAPQKANYLTARALSELRYLLEFAKIHLDNGGVACFPKGRRWEEEVERAREEWEFNLEVHPSKTEAGSAILMIKGVPGDTAGKS